MNPASLRPAILLILLGGCFSSPRSPHADTELLARRKLDSDHYLQEVHRGFGELLQRAKAEQDDFAAGRRAIPPTIDFLVLSGGGDWGAFGAGLLRGWSRVPKEHPLALPEFDIVTGVSTGALIAPFAFAGDPVSLERVDQLYRNPKPDWVQERGMLFFLPHHASLAEVPGLERDLRQNVGVDLVRRIAGAGKGRLLAVNTTNLDDGSPHVFQLVPECRKAAETGDLGRIHEILLASAGIPGIFPFREIDGAMHVDGGVTANIIYGGRIGEEDSLPAAWQGLYPGVPVPKIRYWVIFNNQLRARPAVVPARWVDILTRSIETSTRTSTRTAVRHLFAMAEISRIKRGADIEIRLASIPEDWVPPVEGPFQPATMNSLADLGEKLGADPSSWRTRPLGP